jgi:hypothetical protein
MGSNRITVSKETFDKFVENYPVALKRDVTGIVDPPLMTLNDFSKGAVWPESIVAGASMGSCRPGVPDEYFLQINPGAAVAQPTQSLCGRPVIIVADMARPGTDVMRYIEEAGKDESAEGPSEGGGE